MKAPVFAVTLPLKSVEPPLLLLTLSPSQLLVQVRVFEKVTVLLERPVTSTTFPAVVFVTVAAIEIAAVPPWMSTRIAARVVRRADTAAVDRDRTGVVLHVEPDTADRIQIDAGEGHRPVTPGQVDPVDPGIVDRRRALEVEIYRTVGNRNTVAAWVGDRRRTLDVDGR